VTEFRRARSAEQRAARRAAILEVAAAMLDEYGVAGLSLNELARRVGLAKSNVLRYFDSREAILLELMAGETADWLADLRAERRPRGSVRNRSRRLAELVAGSLARRPALCELLGSQASVLERNVGVEVVERHKRASLDWIRALAEFARQVLPELTEYQAGRFAAGTMLSAGALWPHARPPEAVVAAFRTNPEFAPLRVEFPDTLQELLTVLLAGLLNPDL